MDAQPSVCIMIPVYNQGAFVAKAIESALEQDYENLQILIADDCSTDDTAEMIKPYLKNEKVTYKRNDTNIGRVANYRKCLYEYTNTDWVINLDGDDYYTNPKFVSEGIAGITRCKTGDVLFYQGTHVVKYMSLTKESTFRMAAFEEQRTAADYVYYFSKLSYFSHMSLLYNRALAIESGFYEKDVLSSDIFSVLKLCINNKNKKVILSQNISGMWVKHGANASSTKKIAAHSENIRIYFELMFLGFKKKLNYFLVAKNFLIITAQYFRVLLSKEPADG
jgi:glycosyltransferase involved in cell wall biosynthesis